MVQRKLLHLPNKLGLGIKVQADQVKYGHKLSAGFGPLSPRLQDGKNKGTDLLRKKMKKSRSIRHANVETLKSSSGFNQEKERVSHPGRPPPPAGLQTCPGISLKQPGGKTKDVLPNYMKSTSSFDARKERSRSRSRSPSQSEVSNQKSQTVSFSRNMQRRKTCSPKPSPDSCNTSSKILKRSSSLKLARTLTRTPSFKPVRSASSKKCSKIALCDDMDAHRATCSSTLKDSKFPKYLELNPGGTEAEGTSVMRVCPYTYCSLNGHHHAPLPPLKCFLSARRRMMKTQKNFKVEALSPCRRPKASSTGDKLESQDSAVGSDFFIEVYTKNQYADGIVFENDKEASADENKDGDQMVADVPVEERRGDDRLPGEPPRSEIDLSESIPEEERGSKVTDEISSAILSREETMIWSSSEKDDHEDESKGGIEALDTGSEAADMDLDVGQFTTPTHEEESDYSTQRDGTLAFDFDYLSEADSPDLHEKPEFRSDLSVINWKLFPFDDDIAQEKEHALLEANKLISIGFESEDSYQSSEVSEYSQESGCLSYDRCSITDDDESISRSNTFHNPGYSQRKGDAPETVDSADDSQDLAGKVEAWEEPQEYQDFTTSSIMTEQEVTHKDAEDVPTKVIAESQEAIDECGADSAVEEHIPGLHSVSPIPQIDAQDHPSDSQTTHAAENLNLEMDQLDTKKRTTISEALEPEQHEDALMKRSNLEDFIGETDMVDLKQAINPGVNESILKTGGITSTQEKSTFVKRKNSSPQEPMDSKLKWTITRRRLNEPMENLRGFNPREPNYLPLVPDPEAEKVDLKHQMMDERKNSEEWMIDHALQQAVTKLAPARKRKVALLVEAFEKVMPITKCETHLRSTSTDFPHARPMQACN